MPFTNCSKHLLVSVLIAVAFSPHVSWTQEPSSSVQPLLSAGKPVPWWFAFKFNAETFPRAADTRPTCIFGGKAGGSRHYTKIGQDHVVASSDDSRLQKGAGFLGDSTSDPLGATFDEIYNGSFFYVVWNDQFYRDPALACAGSSSNQCGGKWGHSKGVVAWDDSGAGFVLQVTTPDWPGSGSADQPRKEGNSLGCTLSDDDTDLSQDFFALQLSKDDLLKVLAALAEEGAVTDTNTSQIVKSGGPQDVQEAVGKLGGANSDSSFEQYTLSSGVQLIAKSGGLFAPPWQLVSSVLGGVPLRVATFWQGTLIYSSTEATPVTCWPEALNGLEKPGSVSIALTGTWDGTTIGLSGTGPATVGSNHAKIGISTADGSNIVIFGDMNQDGALSPHDSATCRSSQNTRGGMFFILKDQGLHDSMSSLLNGRTAPLHTPTQ